MKVINTIIGQRNSFGNGLRFFDIRSLQSMVESMPLIFKYDFFCGTYLSNINGKVCLTSELIASQRDVLLPQISAIGIDFNTELYYDEVGKYMTILEALQNNTYMGATAYDILMTCPELTKEQFYAIP